MIEIFRRPQQHTKANFQYNFIIQKTFKVCILSCQRASVPFSTGPGGKELREEGTEFFLPTRVGEFEFMMTLAWMIGWMST